MTTISVPLPPELEEFIAEMVANHRADNKAAVVRRALYRLREEEAVGKVLQAESEIAAGNILHGDLDKLAAAL